MVNSESLILVFDIRKRLKNVLMVAGAVKNRRQPAAHKILSASSSLYLCLGELMRLLFDLVSNYTLRNKLISLESPGDLSI